MHGIVRNSSLTRMNTCSHRHVMRPLVEFCLNSRLLYEVNRILFYSLPVVCSYRFPYIAYFGLQAPTAAEPHSGLLPLDQPAQHGQCVHPYLWDLWAGAWWRWLPVHGLCLPGDIWLLSSPVALCDGESQKKSGERKQVPANRSPVISLFFPL